MDTATYEEIINSGTVLDGTTLNITIKELHARKEAGLVAVLQRILAHNAVEKPPRPAGTFDTSPTWYRIDLPAESAAAIADLFLALEAEHAGEGDKPAPMELFYGNLADKWMPFSYPL
ncbi:hypothetical protein [Flaviaesturariibacter amylovorans]|uniref:Uncharacterized protein n=1 Tax=Flaviaesturariibacter amylovorans TaxID=1084520 RepID=A0ABP8G737_9BACT